MVEASAAHPAVHDGRKPHGAARGVTSIVLQGWVEPVGLDIGLVHHIEPLPRTELVPDVLIRRHRSDQRPLEPARETTTERSIPNAPNAPYISIPSNRSPPLLPSPPASPECLSSYSLAPCRNLSRDDPGEHLVWVVGAADRIEVQALHQVDVLQRRAWTETQKVKAGHVTSDDGPAELRGKRGEGIQSRLEATGPISSAISEAVVVGTWDSRVGFGQYPEGRPGLGAKDVGVKRIEGGFEAWWALRTSRVDI